MKYKADIYPDAILVWLRMLNTISSFQQKWDIFRSLLPFSSHRTKLTRQHSSLVEEVKTLQHQLQIFKQAADREAAWNIFNDGVDRGDVFPLLNMLDPEDKVMRYFLFYALSRLFFIDVMMLVIRHYGSM